MFLRLWQPQGSLCEPFIGGTCSNTVPSFFVLSLRWSTVFRLLLTRKPGWRAEVSWSRVLWCVWLVVTHLRKSICTTLLWIAKRGTLSAAVIHVYKQYKCNPNICIGRRWCGWWSCACVLRVVQVTWAAVKAFCEVTGSWWSISWTAAWRSCGSMQPVTVSDFNWKWFSERDTVWVIGILSVPFCLTFWLPHIWPQRSECRVKPGATFTRAGSGHGGRCRGHTCSDFDSEIVWGFSRFFIFITDFKFGHGGFMESLLKRPEVDSSSPKRDAYFYCQLIHETICSFFLLHKLCLMLNRKQELMCSFV